MLQNCNIYNIVSKYSNFLSYGFVISKLMILSSLYVYELIYTTWSLCSFCKSKLLLETLVYHDFSQIIINFHSSYFCLGHITLAHNSYFLLGSRQIFPISRTFSMVVVR